MEKKDSQSTLQKKFKFCYILRGLPGSGKSTVASQLAGEKGVILSIDKKILEQHIQNLNKDDNSLNKYYENNFKDFCAEIEKGTEIIVVDNTNLCEWEFNNFVKKAQ